LHFAFPNPPLFFSYLFLLWRHNVERVDGNFRLPIPTVLSVDFDGRLAPLVRTLEIDGTEDDGVWAVNFLVVIRAGGAGGAEVADDFVARITLVCITLELALGDFQVLLGDHLIEGVFAAAQELASSAMAWDMDLGRDLDRPFDFTAVTGTFVFRHDYCC